MPIEWVIHLHRGNLDLDLKPQLLLMATILQLCPRIIVPIMIPITAAVIVMITTVGILIAVAAREAHRQATKIKKNFNENGIGV